MNTTVYVLSQKELEDLLASAKKSNKATLVLEAVKEGFSIACVKKEALCAKSKKMSNLDGEVTLALRQITPDSFYIKLGWYISLNEVESGKVYVAFKEQRRRRASTPSYCHITL